VPKGKHNSPKPKRAIPLVALKWYQQIVKMYHLTPNKTKENDAKK